MATTAVWLAATAGAVAADAAAADFDLFFWPLFLSAYRAAHRILGDRHAAEDVAADALAQAHVHWGRIGRESYREAWVVRVATNRALDLCRRGKVHHQPESTTGFEDGTALRVSLIRALQTLPRRQRDVVVLRHIVGLSVADVAAALGIGPGSVRTHLDRGLSRLRNRLGPDFVSGAGADPGTEQA